MGRHSLFKLVCQILVAKDNGAGKARVPQLENVNPQQLMELLQWHKLIAPVAIKMSSDENSKQLPLFGQIKSSYKTQQIHMLAQQAMLKELDAVFKQKAVEYLVFKGCVLSHQLYGHPNARHAKDVDLWVDENNVEAAIGILESLNLVLASPADIKSSGSIQTMMRVRKDLVFVTNTRPAVAVELHWRLDKNRFAYGLSFSEVWQRKALVEIAGLHYPTFDLLDNLRYLPQHGSLAMWGRLKWLLDWHDAVELGHREGVDWAALYNEMQQAGSLSATLLAMSLSTELFDQAPPPPFASARLPLTLRWTRWLVLRSMADNRYPAIWQRWPARLFILKSCSYKAQQVVLLCKTLVSPSYRQ